MSSITAVESMMPLSRKESSSAKAVQGLPNMKLSITKCLNSSLSAMRGHPAFKVIYELVYQELGRDDANQSHVVLDADSGAPLKFIQEHCHRTRIENAIPAQLLGGKQFLHVFARGRLKETAPFRSAV